MKSRLADEQPRIVMVGPFPPPIGGMAFGNAIMRELLEKRGATVLAINISPPNLDRRWRYRFHRIPKVIIGLTLVFFKPRIRGARFYMRISGGLGQIYEIGFLMIARLRGMRCFVSHHSCAYLDRRSLFTRVLVFVGGKRTTHIALSESMATRLKHQYPRTNGVLAISNAALFFDDPNLRVRERSLLRTLGFLSIVSEDKGVFTFLDVAAELERCGLAVAMKLAGPFQDDEMELRVRGRLEQLNCIEYVGAKYGKDKWAFFDSIDVLLFPTTFRYEAEPRTIHEALMCGIPVISTKRACIPDVLTEGSGLVVDCPEQFVSEAVSQIVAWRACPDALRYASRMARARYMTLRGESVGRLEALLNEICHVGATN